MSDQAEVLIVGAGPVGLTMAAFLHFHGISFRIIDKNSHAAQTSNAIGVQARTLELLAQLGIVDSFLEHGNKLTKLHLQANKQPLAYWQLDKVDSPYPYLLSVAQNITEETLLAYLEKHHIKVERNTELVAIEEKNEKVHLTLENKEGKEQLSTKYLCACDGYRSTVRQLSNIAYQGEDMPLNCLIIDAPLNWELEKTEGLVAFTDKLSVIILPLEHSWRVIAEVEHAPEFHCKPNEQPTRETFQAILENCIKEKVTVGNALWASKFLIHERIADTYKKGRVFLSGDAAHAHSPAGAQGMNTGMQDAVNLAWKLAFVLKGQAQATLLDSYEIERRAVAKGIIKFSGALMRFGTIRNKFLIIVRNLLVPIVTQIPFIQKKFAANISEVSINYAFSPLSVGKKSGDVAPGMRMATTTFQLKKYMDTQTIENLGKHFILLDFTGDAKEKNILNHKNVDIIHIPNHLTDVYKTYGMTKGGYALLRPDQYVAYLGDRLDEVKKYIDNI